MSATILPFRPRPKPPVRVTDNETLALIAGLSKQELAGFIVELRVNFKGNHKDRAWRRFIRGLELRYVALPPD